MVWAVCAGAHVRIKNCVMCVVCGVSVLTVRIAATKHCAAADHPPGSLCPLII